MIYKNYLIEMDCLIHHGVRRQGAITLIDCLHENRIPYLIISAQSARTRTQTAQIMNERGFNGVRPANIYTSTMAAVDWVMWNHPERKKASYIGGYGLKQTLEEGGLTISFRDSQLLFVGMNRNMTYSEYSDALQSLLEGALLLSTDSRRTQAVSSRQMIGSGAVVRMLEYAANVKAEEFGRGSANIFEAALRYMRLEKEQVIFVGTDFQKDIIPAHNAGLETVFAANGANILELGMSEELHPDYIIEDLIGLTV